jgi:hypothetical protein
MDTGIRWDKPALASGKVWSFVAVKQLWYKAPALLANYLGSVDLHYWDGRLRPFFCAPVLTYYDVRCAPVLKKRAYPARRSVNVNRP